MRIALFAECYLPAKNGLSAVLYQFKRAVENRGHHVTLVTPRYGSWHANDDTILLTNSIPLGARIEARCALINQTSINKELRRRQIEIIHTHTEFPVGFSGRRAAKALGLPLLHTMHTFWEAYTHYIPFGFMPVITQMLRWYQRHYLRPFSTIVVPSPKTERYISELTPNKQIHIIPNAMDLDRIDGIDSQTRAQRRRALRAKLGIGDDAPLLLFVGRLGKEKRIHTLFHALYPLFRSHPNLQMLIAGDGPLFPKLQTMARQQRLTTRVHLPGFVGWETIFDYYLAGDIFVTASLSETHSMVLIEAASCGLPIVARHDNGANGDQVIHATTGYLANSDRELCGYLAQLIDDPLLRHRFGQRSQQHSAVYNISYNTESILKLYDRIISDSKRSI